MVFARHTKFIIIIVIHFGKTSNTFALNFQKIAILQFRNLGSAIFQQFTSFFHKVIAYFSPFVQKLLTFKNLSTDELAFFV